MIDRLQIRAERDGERTVLATLAGTEPWRPRPLTNGVTSVSGSAAGCWARVALVQSRAMLLAGDSVELELRVGAGAALELVELGATLIHHLRGGLPARLVVSVSIADGGRLCWCGKPMVLAEGSSLKADTLTEIEGRGALLRAESVVLGRSGEQPGELCQRQRITLDGAPLLDETLDTGDRPTLRSPVVAGAGANTIAAVTLAGRRSEQPGHLGVMQAHLPATLWRRAGPDVPVMREAAEIVERFRLTLTADQAQVMPTIAAQSQLETPLPPL